MVRSQESTETIILLFDKFSNCLVWIRIFGSRRSADTNKAFTFPPAELVFSTGSSDPQYLQKEEATDS